MLAILFFLSERMLPPGSPMRRLVRIAAVAILGLGGRGDHRQRALVPGHAGLIQAGGDAGAGNSVSVWSSRR